MNESRGFSALMRLIRPKQWIKNGFVFVPLFFGGALFHTDALLAGVITFFAYSFAASSIYCFNDIFDAEADRRHPVKCHRPIASGAVSVKAAYCLMILMLILSIVISAALDSWKAMGIILFYAEKQLVAAASHYYLCLFFLEFHTRRNTSAAEAAAIGRI